MNKKVVSRTMLILLSISILTSAFDIQQAESSEPPLIEWAKTYGGEAPDLAYSMVQTGDGGYAIAGNGFANLVKTDSAGNMQWNESYGGSADSVVQTSDGGYAIAGWTGSFGAGSADCWLVKTDADGDMEWNQTYGGTDNDLARSVVQTADEGYALAGYTDTDRDGIDYDFWLVKTDSAGNMKWNKTYGGASYDYALSMVQTNDGGYAIAGHTWSFGAGERDFWLVKTDPEGNMQWNNTYGGVRSEEAYSVVQTGDGGYAMAGNTWSFGFLKGYFWLVKTDPEGSMQWNKTYGVGSEEAHSVVQTGDGGYALTGRTCSFGAGKADFWLVKTDQDGNMQWNQTYGGIRWDDAHSVVQTCDGGYALAGYGGGLPYGAGGEDFWLVKIAGPYHKLIVTSSPITGITFTIDGIPETTPYTDWLPEGSYTVEMPETHNGYVWSHWLEDGDTKRTKTVTINTDITLTAVYTPVPSPSEALETLIQTIEAWNLDTGIETSLTSKLKVACCSLDRENENASMGQLTAFMNQLQALRDKKLTDQQADYLISEAQRIIDLIK